MSRSCSTLAGRLGLPESSREAQMAPICSGFRNCVVTFLGRTVWLHSVSMQAPTMVLRLAALGALTFEGEGKFPNKTKSLA